MKPTVYIIAQMDGNDLEFRMIVVRDVQSSVSNKIRIPGRAQYLNGNPYSVYGASVEGFTGGTRYEFTYIISEVISGKME